jgi:autotransporter-associated beta strand protein
MTCKQGVGKSIRFYVYPRLFLPGGMQLKILNQLSKLICRRSGMWCLIAAAILLLNISFTIAADNYWNVTSGDWSDTNPCPWSLGTEPIYSDNVYIQNGGTATVSQSDETCKFLHIGGTNTGRVEMNGGSLTAREIVGDTGIGTFIQTAGTNTTTDLYLGRHTSGKGVYQLSGSGQLIASNGELMGNGGTGSFIQTGGINKCGYLLFGNGSYYGATNASGTYDLSGTGQVIATAEEIGIYGSGTFNHSGGTNSAMWLYLGQYQGFSGSYNLTATGQLNVGYEDIGYEGNGVFTQSGGSNTVGGLSLGFNSTASGTYNLRDRGALNANQENIGRQGSGTFNQSGGTNEVIVLVFGGTNGTYNLNGGTLITLSIIQGSGTAAFNFGGGTLQASWTFSTSLPMTLTGDGGNANINTAGNSIILSGVLSSSGGLNKLGSGTLILSASNSYYGETDINAGMLAVNGSLNSSGLVVVNNGGILGGTGSVGNVTVNSGGHIAPGNSAGTLTLAGDLTLNSGALLDFDLAGAAASDKISMTGSTLYLNGQLFSDFAFNPQTGFGLGTYILIDAGGIQGILGDNLSGNIGGLSASLSISGDDLMLTVVPEPSIWILLATVGLGLFAYAGRRK